MAYELRQELRLTQQLVMTPQLQLSIKLLQLCRLELVDTIQQEMAENPLLEEAQESDREISEENLENADEIPDKQPDALKKLEDSVEFDWRSYVENSGRESYSSFNAGEEREPLEARMTRTSTLADHLTWQLHLSSLNEDEQQIGDLIIGGLNPDGYLKTSLIDIAKNHLLEKCTGGKPDNVTTLNHTNWLSLLLSLQKAGRVLSTIQEFDPVGVAARDLKECLLIQIKFLGKEGSILEKIVKHHLPNLERKRYQVIAANLNTSIEEVVEAAKAITQLEPKPGRPFNDNRSQYITPDIYVFKTEDEYKVVLNGDGMPRLRISNFYLKTLYNKNSSSKATNDYIKNKMNSAIWLIKSIYQRERTIKKVVESIIKFQREFFDHGAAYLKPLKLRDVAEDIEMHESTVSRVTTNKYVHTPHGIFELKYFFNTAISSVQGESVASESVKNKIKKILANENPKHPYSDQKIATILKDQNIVIARRTVAKYREVLGILPSSRRKEFC
ncbi:MAG: RNA polymerase factor sigma-54 [Deltaproteobacteria bacterium]|jgi:RNA polymerase sigma-54 factor|nr:RNA polymerase factor sigma-54 [Deltaproteobacteria bacterium]